jgi:hypothetical protein
MNPEALILKKLKEQKKVLKSKIEELEMQLKIQNLELEKINLQIDNATLKKSVQDVKKATLNEDKIKESIIKEIGKDLKDKICTTYIYLFELGKTIDLYTTFNVPESKVALGYSIYKFGKTENITSRERDHKRLYSNHPNVKINLVISEKCSNKNAFKNEGAIKSWFKDNDYSFVTKFKDAPEDLCSKFSTCKELVIIHDKDLKKVKEFYKFL